MFGQGEFDQQELAGNSDEIIGTARDLWVEAVRVALVIAEVTAKEIARRREQMWEQQRKAAARKIWEDRQRAEPTLSAAMSEEFWQDPTPQDIGQAWQVATEWAPSDPNADAVLQHMRDRLKTYGLEPDGDQLNIADLSRALALGAPQRRAEAAEARAEAETWSEVSSMYVIRDPNDSEQVLHQGELRTVPGEDIEAASARALKEWAAADGRDLDDRIGIETFANEEVPGATPVARVTGDRAQAVVDAESRRQQAMVFGAEKGSLDERHHAVYAQLDRNEEAAALLGEGAEGYDELAEARKRLELEAEAVEAEMRGEDPSYVYKAAHLRSAMSTEQWWAGATPERVEFLWDQVREWPETWAKTQMTAFLDGLDTVEGKQVADILMDAAETGYADRAAQARVKADELFRKAFAAGAEAGQLSNRASTLEALPGVGAHTVEDLRNRAMALAEDAYMYNTQAAVAIGQAVHLEGIADDPVKLTPEALRERFNERWGHEPDLASATSLTVPESGGTPEAGRSSAGSSAPSAAGVAASVPEQASPAAADRDAEGAGAVGVAAIGLPKPVKHRRQRVEAGAVPLSRPAPARARSAGTGRG
ncbi:hypothetical protein [Streptomyces nodosus]|uniref:hypothetical protein n=1 Tax=Streptomyces nodosus TaxID=40318 RepID=UPI00381ECC89